MSRLSKNSISIFLHHCLKPLKCFIFVQTPLQLDIWLQSYAGFDNAKNNIKQMNLNPVFANISKTTSPTSDSFLLIMSHIRREQVHDGMLAALGVEMKSVLGIRQIIDVMKLAWWLVDS